MIPQEHHRPLSGDLAKRSTYRSVLNNVRVVAFNVIPRVSIVKGNSSSGTHVGAECDQ